MVRYLGLQSWSRSVFSNRAQRQDLSPKRGHRPEVANGPGEDNKSENYLLELPLIMAGQCHLSLAIISEQAARAAAKCKVHDQHTSMPT